MKTKENINTYPNNQPIEKKQLSPDELRSIRGGGETYKEYIGD